MSARAAAANAIKFGSRLREMRLHLCQTSKECEGVREFIDSSYVSMKRANPDIPILIRECSGVAPRLYVRYERGREASFALGNMPSEHIAQLVSDLASSAEPPTGAPDDDHDARSSSQQQQNRRLR